MEAIILAGGLGTRLRSVLKDQPKALARLGNFPFLYYLISYLKKEGVNRYIFSLGYLHDQIEDFLQQHFPDLNYVTVIEKTPMGTGGAIKLCMNDLKDDVALLVNADTFFELDLSKFYNTFKDLKADCVIALTEMTDFDRYGVVKLDNNNKVVEFIEKKATVCGLINTGLILLDKRKFDKLLGHLEIPFSFEKDVLEPNIGELKMYGISQRGFFIDIGIPEDYIKAQEQLAFFENIIRK